MTAQYIIHKDGEKKEFDDEQEFRNMVDLLEDQDVDFETETVTDGEIDDEGDADDGFHRSGAKDDNQDDLTDHTSGDSEGDDIRDATPVEANGKSNGHDTEPVVDNSDTLPSRELTDDPIEWLRQGSDEFVTTIKGTPVITKKGFRVLQHKYDISTGSEIIVGPEETDHEFARAKAWAEMPDGRRAEAHASAHTDRGDDHFLLTSMADTRAKSRALSDVTGVGAVAIEEMAGVDPDD